MGRHAAVCYTCDNVSYRRWTVGQANAKATKKRRGGIIVGALAGMVAGLLLAPKSGRETREQLFGQGGIGGQVDRIKGAIGAGKDSAADQNEALRRKIEETRERLRSQMDAEGNGAGGEDAYRRPRRHGSRRPELNRLALTELGAAAACGVAAFGLAYLLHEAQWVRRVDRRLPAPDADAALDGLTVVQLSDFHAGFTPSLNLRAARKAVDLAMAAEPDLVVITGDFAGGTAGIGELRRQLLRLAPPLGVVGVFGNHDHGDSKAPFVKPTDPHFVEECGVRLLTNETATIERAGATVQIGGVDDTDGGHDDLPAVLARLDHRPGVLRLLLSHHADVVKRTAPGDFHMTFAGDTHGGQLCLPIPGRRVMLSDLHAEFAEGGYDVGGRPLYVTRGVGTSMLPFRAFCRPEIVVFHVEAGG